MNISSISTKYSSYFPNKQQKTKANTQAKNPVNVANKTTSTPSFKSIYIEDIADVGEVAEKKYPTVFLPKDALLLNEIATQYPNQDCFIRRGYADLPALAYRERPPQVQVFTETMARQFNTSIDPEDKNYPVEPLLLYPDSLLTRFFGVTSYISLNPSLPNTVKVGYELHKRLLKKQYQILEIIGKTDKIDLGEDSVIQRAHKEIEEDESAVTRYLLECSFAALTDRASASQIYESNYPKVQTRLEAKRKYDVTTCKETQPLPPKSEKPKDVCDLAMKYYPNVQENKRRIEQLTNYMSQHGIILG